MTAAVGYATEDEDTQITASEAAMLCGVSVQAIINWVGRGYLAPVGINRAGRKVYRLGDVRDTELEVTQRTLKQVRL